MTTPRYEDYRVDEPVGRVAHIYGASPAHPIMFHESAIAAFYISIDALSRFQALDSLGGNQYVIPAIGLWFISVESFVSTIYKVAQIDAARAGLTSTSTSSAGVRPTQRVAEKYAAIEDYFGAPTPRPRRPIEELREFARLRNVLFHDLTAASTPSFTETIFASKVENVNEVDLIQAIVISTDVFTYFRHLFPDTDLMPSIQVGVAFDKLDALNREVIFPSFFEILTAKGLTTELRTDLSSQQIQAAAPLPLSIVIKAEGPSAPKSSADLESIARDHLERAIDARPVAADQFQIPNYVR